MTDRDAAFRRLYEAELAYVLRTLRRLGVGAGEVQDLAHEVFLVVHRKLDDYDRARPPRPWLFGIAYRTAAHHFERAHHRREVAAEIDRADERPSVEEVISDQETRAEVLAALATVEIDQRAVCILHDLDELPAPQIASALDVPLNTVYSRLRLGRLQWHKALRRLRQKRELS